ncbi:MAG: hypothetical protein CMM50_03375 [Rhodospirillaceae bacterium]|nr:hypothetical protein [Rhodospirillaceae bacterium]
MPKGLRIGAVAALLLGLAGLQPAAAQDSPVHLRGQLTSANDNGFEMTTDEGKSATVGYSEHVGIFTVSEAAVSDIKDGQFVGITSIESGGERVAIEVHIFDDSLRGLGEGHYPWDLMDTDNMMTNANVAEIESVSDGQTLQVDYKLENNAPGSQTIRVPDDATVVNLFPADMSLMKPGETVFVIAQAQEDGSYMALAVVVGQDGVVPPM